MKTSLVLPRDHPVTPRAYCVNQSDIQRAFHFACPLLSARGPLVLARGPPGPARGSLMAARGPPLSLTGRPVTARECLTAGLPPVKAKSDPYRARGPMQGLKGTHNGWVGLCKVCEHERLKWAHFRRQWVCFGEPAATMPSLWTIFSEGIILVIFI